MEIPKQIPDSERVTRLEKAVKRAQYWAYGGVLAAVAVGAIGAHESGSLSRRLDNILLNPNTSLAGQEIAGIQPDKTFRARPSKDGTLHDVMGSICEILEDLNVGGKIDIYKRETHEGLHCVLPETQGVVIPNK
jgi:hypothetical protein